MKVNNDTQINKGLQTLLALLLSVSAWQSALAQPFNMVRFSESGVLLLTADPSAGKAECQPLKGDAAIPTGPGKKAFGTEITPLRVLTGRCKGATGWSGVKKLESLDANISIDGASSTRFSESDILFSAITPNLVKSQCQPLRGDRTEIIGSTKLMQVEVEQVKILSGRCAGTIGWAGITKLETILTGAPE